MSEILKTEALVLSKLNYGDTSSIATLFTKDYGKISVIVKGGRTRKSKFGAIVDPLNNIQIVFYKKDTRDVQLISDASLLLHFQSLKNDLQKLKYAYAIAEIVKNLMAENEANIKIYEGLVRIFSRLDSSNEKPEISFGRFFLFFLKELGYEFNIDSCAICGNKNFASVKLYYNFDKGLICGRCTKDVVEIYEINLELFQYLICLKNNVDADTFSSNVINRANFLLEKHLKYHVTDFKGIKSLELFK